MIRTEHERHCTAVLDRMASTALVELLTTWRLRRAWTPLVVWPDADPAWRLITEEFIGNREVWVRRASEEIRLAAKEARGRGLEGWWQQQFAVATG